MNAFLLSHAVTDSTHATHLSLVGGKYNIRTPDDVTLFFALYASCAHDLFLIERVLYPSRFFVDLDSCNVTNATLQTICNSLNIGAFEIYVNSENARNFHVIFREYIIETPIQAKLKCAEMGLFNVNVRQSIDTSVYHTGLRMVGSKKGYGKSPIYVPIDKHSMLCMRDLYSASIHHDPMKATLFKPQRTLKTARVHTNCETNEAFDFSLINTQYSHIVPSKIILLNENVVILNTNIRWCSNINDHHKSNTISFVINRRKKECHQICHCRCSHRTCSTFRSKIIKIKVIDFYKIEKSIV